MAFPNTNYTDVITAAIESRTGQVADNVTAHNALLTQIKSNGGVKTISGGSSIVEELSFAANTNAAWYTGYDTLAVAAQDSLSAANFAIKQASVAVPISGLELLQVAGREEVINLLEARLDIA